MLTIDEIKLAAAIKNLKIVFLTKNPDMNRGSYRVWVYNLTQILTGIGANIFIKNIKEVNEENLNVNIILFDKGIEEEIIIRFKNKNVKHCICGAINPPAESKFPVDFVIAGSREEESSLSYYSNILIAPLIEPLIHALPLKIHLDSRVLKICYHGNNLHLSSFLSSGLKAALERFDRELKLGNRDIELTIISNKENPRWIIGKPKVKINYIKYNWQHFPSQIKEFDIGVVPNCYYRKPRFNFSYLFKKGLNIEFSNSDIIQRMKNKSNFGKLLVFMQAGVPAVGDLTPSHFELLGDPANGYCASNEMAWLRAFRKLAFAAERNRIAANAKSFVKGKYDPTYWAKRLLLDLYNIYLSSFQKNIIDPVIAENAAVIE